MFVGLRCVLKPPGLLTVRCYGDLVYLAGKGPLIALSGTCNESHDGTRVHQQMISVLSRLSESSHNPLRFQGTVV